MEATKLWNHTDLVDGWSLRVYTNENYLHRTPEVARQVDNTDVAVVCFQPDGSLDVWSADAPISIPGSVMSALVTAYTQHKVAK
jgi:hypothetical protein